MSTLVLKRLKTMIGKPYLYKGNQITLKNYHVMGEEGKTQIDIEDGSPIKVKDVNAFVNECLPVEADGPETTALSTQVVKQTNGLLTTLQETLMDNINRVRKDEKYIKQANVINSSVNALIGLAKMQIQVERMKNGGR